MIDPKYKHLSLKVLDEEFTYLKLKDSARASALLQEVLAQGVQHACFFKTPTEFSLVVPRSVPIVEPSKEEAGWRALTIQGEMPFGTVQGLIATVCGSLKETGIGVCVISTFDTDFFLVRTARLEEAKAALVRDGWNVV